MRLSLRDIGSARRACRRELRKAINERIPTAAVRTETRLLPPPRRSRLRTYGERHWKHLGRNLDPDDFTDAQAIAAIERITRGNFRLPERLFPQINRVLKINDLETITDEKPPQSILVIGN